MRGIMFFLVAMAVALVAGGAYVAVPEIWPAGAVEGDVVARELTGGASGRPSGRSCRLVIRDADGGEHALTAGNEELCQQVGMRVRARHRVWDREIVAIEWEAGQRWAQPGGARVFRLAGGTLMVALGATIGWFGWRLSRSGRRR